MIAAAERPAPFRPGDAVRVVEGPFRGYAGRIASVKRIRRTVLVVVDFFGRETPVDLDYSQVELVS